PPGPEGSNGSGQVGRRRGAGVGHRHFGQGRWAPGCWTEAHANATSRDYDSRAHDGYGGAEPRSTSHASALSAASASYPLPLYDGTPWSGIHNPAGGAPVCQNTSIGMPPRGYQ